MTPSDSPAVDPSQLDLWEQQLRQLQAQITDFKELNRIETLSPQQQVEIQDQILALEARLKQYMGHLLEELKQELGSELVSQPMLIWQVVRFSGLGFLLGVLLQWWLCRQL